ncbi:tRNA 2-thiouridine synthesizing protein D [Pseudoalteromonas rubra]|uniref:tRNA 2-thiouridine synthesizing protein D n=1 Tax=Pseudoalteromonas rubra TaxID=43658 RepID=A0A8T0C6P0_9GAMM|nr:DsrE family protein [Pseudoalteromonas rubra]KAF7785675.1 tRNA 2-thiouridine synthesizing protein D [Pseudoalteromonas rubra]
MSQYVLSLHSNVSDHDALQQLVRFAKALQAQDHQIKCIFLYQQAVLFASQHFSLASDELQPAQLWQSLHDAGIALKLCVTAAEKYGLDTSHCGPFEVAGLAEFAMLATKADKWVQFK